MTPFHQIMLRGLVNSVVGIAAICTILYFAGFSTLLLIKAALAHFGVLTLSRDPIDFLFSIEFLQLGVGWVLASTMLALLVELIQILIAYIRLR